MIALLVLVPFATRRGTTPSEEPAPQSAPVVAALDVDAAEGFRVGRDLLFEVTDGEPWDTLRVLVALLPDPDESSLDWTYDAHLAAVRRALEASGYVSDRLWFPHPGDSADVTRDSATVRRRAPDVLPGVMVFRGESGRSIRDLAIVYTVGELPTAGVFREALRTALEEIDSLSEASPPRGDGGRADDTLRIIGPTFSGSAPSLRAVLERAARERCRPMRVISGSATSPRVRGMFVSSPPCSDSAGGIARISYDATVHTDDEYAALVGVKLLAPLGLDSSDVALLTEANTLYGAGAGGGDRSGEAEPAAFLPDSLRGEGSKILRGATVIAFPLNISSVRSAYDRSADPNASDPVFRGASPRLPLPLELERRPREGPPARSRLTAPMLDQVLSDMIETLRAKRVRAVGILATDVRDKLFLAEVVHRALPDVLLFTYEGNALFARRDLIGSVRGMVVASSYPLLLQNVDWTGGDGYFPFGAEGAAGVFNATLFQLGRPGLVQQYRVPGAFDVSTSRVPLWLTEVGSGEMLPLAVVDPGDDTLVVAATASGGRSGTGGGAGDEEHSHHGRAGPLEILAMVLAVLQPIWFGWVLFAPRYDDPGGPSRSLWWWRTPIRRWDDHWRALDHAAGIAALLSLCAPLMLLHGLATPWQPQEGGITPFAILLAVELGLTLAMLVAMLVLGVSDILGRANRRPPLGGGARRRSWSAWLVSASPHMLACVLAGLASVYCVQILREAGRDETVYGLYRHRTLDLSSGVSGLLPLLISVVAIIMLLFWHRDRRGLLHVGCGRPDDRAEPARGSGVRTGGAEQRQNLDLLPALLVAPQEGWTCPPVLRRILTGIVRVRVRLEVVVPWHPVALTFGLGLLAVGALTVAFGFPPFGGLETVALEGSVVTPIFGLALGIGFLSIGTSLIQLIAVWQAFKSYLSGLADTPLAPAFGRLPKRLRTLGRLHFFDPTADRPGRALAEAGHEYVWTLAGEEYDGLELSETPAEKGLVCALAKDLRGTDHEATRARSLALLIQVVTSLWNRHPRHRWAGEMADPGAPTADESAGTTSDRVGVWLRCAEDLLALEVARHVDWVLRNLRRLVVFLLFVMLFTTALLESLPFSYHAALTTAFIVLMGITILTVVVVMAHLARDDILSRITATEPGKLNWYGPSVFNAVVFIALPVLGVLGTEVDPVGRTMFGWVQDLLRILSVR